MYVKICNELPGALRIVNRVQMSCCRPLWAGTHLANSNGKITTRPRLSLATRADKALGLATSPLVSRPFHRPGRRN